MKHVFKRDEGKMVLTFKKLSVSTPCLFATVIILLDAVTIGLG